MTTKILVTCPDMSTHDAIVTVEQQQADGSWTQTERHSVAPTEQAPPVYIDAKTRVTVTEEARARVTPEPLSKGTGRK